MRPRMLLLLPSHEIPAEQQRPRSTTQQQPLSKPNHDKDRNKIMQSQTGSCSKTNSKVAVHGSCCSPLLLKKGQLAERLLLEEYI